ncbi:MAG: hypothetical protein HY286_03890 [Planctomycetes bacterium]|nr:hypothetical protein [Planctomycetota bacterium]
MVNRRLLVAVHRLTRRITIILILFCGGVFALHMLLRPQDDDTAITNSGTVVAATLAAVSFSYSRALDDAKTDKKRLIHAGECFALTAIFMLASSFLEYSAHESRIASWVPWTEVEKYIQIFYWPLVAGGVAAFLFALIPAHQAIDQLSDVLWERIRAESKNHGSEP